MKNLFCSLAFFFFLASCGGEKNSMEADCLDASGDTTKLAQYEITFSSTWNDTEFPIDYPSNPHYSPMVVSSHNSAYTMWKEGELATKGVKEVAETGKTDPLVSELYAARTAKKVCGYKVASGGITVKNGLGTGKITVTVHEDFPFISLITMIAPSPDWFVGILDLNLRDSGNWISAEETDANPWDAGTDSGTTYTSPNASLDPQIPISKLDTNPFPTRNNKLRSLGTFKINKLN